MDAAKAIKDRAEKPQIAVNDREDELEQAEAHLKWRSRVVAKVVKSMKGLVPKSLRFVVDALEGGHGVLREPKAVRFRFIEEHRNQFPTERLCRVSVLKMEVQ